MTDSGTAATDARRTLRFETIDEVLSEIDLLVAAEHAGTLSRTGNWTTGQIFGHLAAWIEYAYDGYPAEMRPPWFVRAIARLVKRRFFNRPMQPGFRIPGVTGGTFGTEAMSTEEGARRLREALARLKNHEPARHHSPALGPLTDDERIALALRHAELHMGFLCPE